MKHQSSYAELIKKYWFYNRTKINKVSSAIYLLSFVLLSISLLDLRGAEEKIEADIPDQKTIILIDSSASMLAEDVKPNRYKKALLMARHYVKKAVGHQISIVLFSDIQRRVVPFTDDIDLLDARIEAMEDLDISRGGSRFGQAIMESLIYLKNESPKEKPRGNILIFTDAELTDEDYKVDIPLSVNVALVGIGTRSGAKIPLRSKSGSFNGYKKYNRVEVVSKLNEDYISKLSGNIKSFKYWIVSSFSIPTEEILSFFREKFKSTLSKGEMRVQPVVGHFLIIGFIIFFIISTCLRFAKLLFLSLFYSL